MPLHTFVAGESVNVAENLDANFAFLLNLIQTGGTGGSLAAATGTAATFFFSQQLGIGVATATGTSVAQASPTTQLQSSAIGAATGSEASSYIGAGNDQSAATATGTSTSVAFNTAATIGAATATGAETSSYVGSATAQSVVTATGASTATGIDTRNAASAASAQGLAAVAGVGLGGAIESVTGATSTNATTLIFGSTIPGTTSGSLNSFALTASPGTVIVNGVNDNSANIVNAVELYYSNHTVFVENTAGSWFSWASANTWTAAVSPVPVVITESVEGKILTLASDVIRASSTPGTAAPVGATVGNGELVNWTITANPGQIIRGGVTDTTTANVIELYYHLHDVWYENSALQWFSWNGTTYTAQTSPPIPTTPSINVAIVPNQVVNQTISVSGTYQDFTGSGNPILQYADNFAGVVNTTTWSGTNKTGITLSNSNLTATSNVNATTSTAISTTSFSSGKVVFEITATTLTSNWTCGIADATFSITSGLGDTTDSFALQPNFPSGSQALIYNGAIVSSTTGHNSANGDKITVAVDFGNSLIWFTDTAMRAAGFTWNNNGSANPATGTGGIAFTFTGGGFIAFNEFDTGGVAGLNTTGPFAVSTPAGFTSWDVSSTTTWLPFPSSVNVTPTAWSFVHPPIGVVNATQNVAVRDSVNTGVVGISNTFQVSTPGVVTLGPMTLSNSSVGAGLPAGTVVGTLTIPASGGTFTGTVASNNANFSVSGTGGSRSFITTAVLGVNPGISVTLTATMAGAVNSGETLTTSVAVTAESPSATAVTTIGPSISGSATNGAAGSQLLWALVAATAPSTGNQVLLNGVAQTITSAVTELYYINHTLYIASGTVSTTWQFYNGTVINGSQLVSSNLTSAATPIPNITLTPTTQFSPGINGPTGIFASLISNNTALPGVTWTEDSASFVFSGNQISTTGALPAGTYPVNVTATIT